MVTKVFSIYDSKGSMFGQPFFQVHTGVALRSFSDLVNDKQTTINKHPDDYKLYQLGEYDDVSGGLSPLAQPLFVASATEFLDK